MGIAMVNVQISNISPANICIEPGGCSTVRTVRAKNTDIEMTILLKTPSGIFIVHACYVIG